MITVSGLSITAPAGAPSTLSSSASGARAATAPSI
jgi:hypothetical protein